MPALAQTLVAVATTEHEITLSPAIHRRLLTKFKQYQSLKEQLDTLKAQMDTIKGEVGTIRDETGEQSIELDGYRITLVAPIRKVFNAKHYVSLGGDIETYNKAMIDTPTKPYEKISLPGEKSDH